MGCLHVFVMCLGRRPSPPWFLPTFRDDKWRRFSLAGGPRESPLAMRVRPKRIACAAKTRWWGAALLPWEQG